MYKNYGVAYRWEDMDDEEREEWENNMADIAMDEAEDYEFWAEREE